MKSHVKSLLALLAAAAMATPLAVQANEAQPAAAKVDPAKGQALSTQVCAACHTADGSRGSPAYPILQGQHPEYLAKQLAEFKAGKRENAIMKGFASALSDEDMKNVAAFYSSKQAKPGAAKNKDLVVLGEKIYRGGIADRKVPACAGCHSPSGAGMPAQYPRLSGQHADYTAVQLTAFRDGIRKNNAVMTGVAAKMNDREIKAVSDYIAGLH
ncbi:cytochrome c4 [Sphaerotilus montanus]|jgi:cytochrome c553|uniref:Cytochrome c553 n=1 Tax=Sphaerotilus montanus TaxID=522889 RepID=A0A7Y9QYJ9_9BURK|nr:c-type cytochrome [Sphaerotilus montanus]MBP8270564.1 cytochrome c4 [Sphaerotilus sp.]NYG32989.1 cytochrome c553 [Sphaerotilus montanus]NZD56251.1 cytochrome c4 [Sphaerotilus montanus]